MTDVLAVLAIACYLASALWLGSSVYRAAEPAARGRRVAGLAIGVVAVVAHCIWLWSTVFDREALVFTMAETASLIGLPIGKFVKGKLHMPERAFEILSAVGLIAVFAISLSYIVMGGYNPFIYFNF